ncbi:MAG: condensation domain-containing protein, partial [Psychrosphaera sp.]|nr:condensation domain-containing protein [Psychrosphaera sp.]
FAEPRPPQLLMICHHLVTDGYATELIIQRLTDNYQQLTENSTPTQPVDNYADTNKALKALTTLPVIREEVLWWDENIPDKLDKLPVDWMIEPQEDTFCSVVFAQEQLLSSADTRVIMQTMVDQYKVKSVTLILYGLSRAIADWHNADSNKSAAMLIDLMRYGREVKENWVDLSQSLGWHGVTVPLLVDSRQGKEMIETIKSLHQTLEDMPYSGSHFNLLKYLCDDPSIRQTLTAKPHPEIMLNYFPGDLTITEPDVELVTDQPMDISLDPYVAEQNYNGYKLSFWVRIINGKIGVNAQYSQKIYRAETVNRLIGECIAQLEQVVQTYHRSMDN